MRPVSPRRPACERDPPGRINIGSIRSAETNLVAFFAVWRWCSSKVWSQFCDWRGRFSGKSCYAGRSVKPCHAATFNRYTIVRVCMIVRRRISINGRSERQSERDRETIRYMVVVFRAINGQPRGRIRQAVRYIKIQQRCCPATPQLDSEAKTL